MKSICIKLLEYINKKDYNESNKKLIYQIGLMDGVLFESEKK